MPTKADIISDHQSKNSKTGYSFETKVANTMRGIKCLEEVIHGEDILIVKEGNPDKAVKPDIRVTFKREILKNVELVFDCTNSMRNDRINGKKYIADNLFKWTQKSYLSIIVFPDEEEMRGKYKNFEEEVYACKREVMMQANDVGLEAVCLALIEGDIPDFINALNDYEFSKAPNAEELLNISKNILLSIRPQYKESEFAKKYPKYRRPYHTSKR